MSFRLIWLSLSASFDTIEPVNLERGAANMSTDNRLMIKNLQKLEHFFTITSRATNLPYAQCDETTFDDQAFLFSQEEDAADFCAKLNEDSYPSSVLRVEQNQIQKFYTGLYLTGINRVAFHNGTGFTYLPLEEIVTLKKPVQDAKTPPVINTALQLTGIYFLQELRRPGKDNRDPERLSKLREMEQELMADLVRSRFILALDITDVKGRLDLKKPDPNLKMPYLKNPSGDILQPVFSDLWEFEKFKGKSTRKLQLVTVPFKGLSSTAIPGAKGYALNPSGFNLVLLKEKIDLLAKQAGS
ncbi:hypothetical protein B5E82_00590 [Lachnoclostridium sp. An138]|nr:hypothetical protein B5E82_00590 [Lachnoclostridium sp. An138]